MIAVVAAALVAFSLLSRRFDAMRDRASRSAANP